MRFEDRVDAGRQLATRLDHLRQQNPIVVALPRGGVPVGFEIAQALGAPLDVLIARKLGAPGHAELGIGAIAQGGAFYINTDAVAALRVSREYLDHVSRAELAEIDRRLNAYRGAKPPLDVHDRTVILVDDGLATGVTTRAAIRALRKQEPRAIVLAVPVCAASTAEDIRQEVDEVVCGMLPDPFQAVGLWYVDFTQTNDEEVLSLLARSDREAETRAQRARNPGQPGQPEQAPPRGRAG
jgi:putative phosphoribosyl transferase